MNPKASWVEEFWRILLLVALASIIGAAVGELMLFLLLALLAYTLRNLFNLQRLANWMGNPDVNDIPIHFGLWGDLYSRIARLSARHNQREKKLTTLLNEYASSTSALPDAAVALDPQGRIRWFNDAASRLLGLQPAKDIGLPLSNLFRNPEFASFIRNRDYTRTLQAAAPGNHERKLEVRLSPYGEGQTLLLAQDITERIRHERVRKDFVANVSHELRTPLTVLSGFIENLQDDESLRETQRLQRPLDLMAQQTARMRQIVEDLLLLARLESDTVAGETVEVDIGSLLHVVADECRSFSSSVPAIECQVRSARRLRGDPKQLRSVVSNLVVNALHHTPSDGNVTLIWEDDGRDSLLQVVDDGEGIAAEHLPRLTERFYRADTGRSRERGGTGLGLAIVKHILNRHQAALEIESEPGRGSRFVCRFPPGRLID